MRIAVNARHLIAGKMEGIGLYSYETIRRMVAGHPELEFHLIFDRAYDDSFVFGPNVVPHVVAPPARHPLLWYLWYEYALPGLFRRIRPDAFYSPDGFMSLRARVPTALVIHDLAFEHFPGHVPALVGRYYRYFTPRYAGAADALIAVSEATRQDIAAQYGIDAGRITLAGNGVRKEFRVMTDGEKQAFREKFTRGESYLFFVGAMHPRKNIDGLIRAYGKFRDRLESKPLLVLTGRMAWMSGEIQRAYDESKYKAEILFTGHLDSETLARYTAAAGMVCYLSLFEGFGVPVLEAMHAEVPLLCSNLSSIPEVAGEAALYADPHSIESMAAGMVKLWMNPELQDRLVASGRGQRQKFSWDSSAEAIWQRVQGLLP